MYVVYNIININKNIKYLVTSKMLEIIPIYLLLLSLRNIYIYIYIYFYM